MPIIPNRVITALLRSLVSLFVLLTACLLPAVCAALPAHDIVFTTQPPFPYDFATMNATFGNHRASLDSAPRGGDLYIRYADGTLRNLTQAAGYGSSGTQGANAIVVRDPAVHWDGAKIIFSMAIGATTLQYHTGEYRFQLYEITNFGKGQTPVITKVPNQPPEYNNVNPTYGSDDRIIFVSDRPRDGRPHLYPQRDEYESTASNTGLWSLNPAAGDLFLMDHSPSGDFSPSVDSFGRVIMTRWDHMQRDQQVGNPYFSPFNYSSEEPTAQKLASTKEVYPEPRERDDPELPANLEPHDFNQFFPWMINQDGTGLETINHVGRHELSGYFNRTFNDDPNLEENYGQFSRVNQNELTSILQIRESPTTPGRYYGTDCPEFGSHASGQIVALAGPPTLRPDQMTVTYITARATADYSDAPPPEHSGFYRDPLPLSDGSLVAVHSMTTVQDENIGTTANPASRYAFRLKTLKKVGDYYVPDAALTPGIRKTISYYDPDNLVTYANVLMWELSPVEVMPRTRPPLTKSSQIEAPEQAVFTSLGIDPEEVRNYLKINDLALLVSRNLTTRDSADRQQPFNLKIDGADTQTVGAPGKIYPISLIQFFQGDLIRGYGGYGSSEPGRRVLAQPLHSATENPFFDGGPDGSIKIGSDGSMAAFVPARRAMTWHLTDQSGASVVKERYWLTFQPGEIRLCGSCHGVNHLDQAGNNPPTNSPQALDALLRHWSGLPPGVYPTPAATAVPTPVPGAIRAGFSVIRLSSLFSRAAGRRVARVQVRVRALSQESVGRAVELIENGPPEACAGNLKTIDLSLNPKIINLSVPIFRRSRVLKLELQSEGTSIASREINIEGRKRALPGGQGCVAALSGQR